MKDTLVIEHVITIFFKSIESKRYTLTKKIFKYYIDLRNVLIEKYNIKLNFTIVGSNKEISLNLFNDYFSKNNDIFNDSYIEFDQQNLDFQGYGYSSNFFQMLNEKWKTGLIYAAYKKTNDIIVLRGSNDFVDPNIYLQIASQYDNNNDKLYIASKSIPELDIYNISIMLFSELGDKLNYDTIKFENYIIWDNQYRQHNMNETIGTNGFIGLNTTAIQKMLVKNFNSYWNEIEIENYIRQNITNFCSLTNNTFYFNIKINEEITSDESLFKEISLQNNYNNTFNKFEQRILKDVMYMIEYFNSEDINCLVKYLEKKTHSCNYFDKNLILQKCIYNECNQLIPVNIPYFNSIRFILP